MNKLLAAAVWTLVLSVVPARAQASSAAEGSRLHMKGSASVSAERLFGFNYTSFGSGFSATTVSILGGSGVEAAAGPYGIPRLGLDYFLADFLSLGLGADFSHVSLVELDRTVLGVNPRLGFFARVSDSFALWPRAGLGFVTIHSDNVSTNLLAVTVDVNLVLSPVAHFGFLLGPALDIGVAGTRDLKITQIGLQAGLVGLF